MGCTQILRFRSDPGLRRPRRVPVLYTCGFRVCSLSPSSHQDGGVYGEWWSVHSCCANPMPLCATTTPTGHVVVRPRATRRPSMLCVYSFSSTEGMARAINLATTVGESTLETLAVVG